MSHDDFKFEPIPGLPEALPKGEEILWQGRPSALRLAREAYALPWVAAYFVLLCVWRIGVSSTEVPLGAAVAHAIPFAVIGVVACGILMLLAYVQSRATIYTLTNKRVAMRIGAALTMTLNLPYVQIVNAGVKTNRDGTGTISFEVPKDTRFSYLMTWPHVRPWKINHTQPSLRAIPDVMKVARIFAEAAEQRMAEPKLARAEPMGASPVAAE